MVPLGQRPPQKRLELAKALKKPDLAYFLVCDDWQSIYRFTGSHVGVIHECVQYLGYTQRENLTRTFRSGDGILKPSSTFVQLNPEQTRRGLVAHSQAGDEGITVIAANDPVKGGGTTYHCVIATRRSSRPHGPLYGHRLHAGSLFDDAPLLMTGAPCGLDGHRNKLD